MRARWVLPYPVRDAIIGQALVATWWPWKYYFISTIELDHTSPLQRLTNSITQGVPYGEAVAGQTTYLTNVFRCDKHGFVRDIEDRLYERAYADISEARKGHDEAVDLLQLGC